jgi:chromosome segregation ATPase
MRPLRLRIIFELILGAVVVTSLLLMLRQWRRINDLQHQQEADAQSLRLLRQALGQKGLQNIPTEVIGEGPSESEQAAIAKREETITRLDQELAEAKATIATLQTQLSTANDETAKAQASAQESVQKQQAASQAQMQDLQKKLDSAIAQSAIARQRVEALEADNTKLNAETAAVATQTANLTRIVSNLRDLDRRRDTYLTSILRRYRDITSEFRAMSSMLDMSHDPNHDLNSGACSDVVLTRIQNAVSSAEDDLRQINELNDRTQKLEKQLPKS